MLFHKRRQRFHALRRNGAHPFAGVHVPLHQNETDRLVDIAARKHDKERRFPHKARQAHQRQHHRVHKRNFADCAERRVARGSIRIVLHPVAHANNRRHAVNHQHVRTDLHRFAGKTHRGKQRLVDTKQHQTYAQNRAAAQEHKAFCALVGCVQLAGAHACADQNGSRI